jgi:bifunctional DNase/RNase
MASYSNLSVVQVRTAVPASTGAEAGMVVLQEDTHPRRSLRIIIGSTEAKAIHSAWQGTIGGRPNTWDVFVSAMVLLGARISRVVITAVEQERHYFATLELEDEGVTRSLSCRPSDGIALALRAYGCEIVAAEEVLMTAGVLPDGSRPLREPEPPADEPEPPADEPDPSEDEPELPADQA